MHPSSCWCVYCSAVCCLPPPVCPVLLAPHLTPTQANQLPAAPAAADSFVPVVLCNTCSLVVLQSALQSSSHAAGRQQVPAGAWPITCLRFQWLQLLSTLRDLCVMLTFAPLWQGSSAHVPTDQGAVAGDTAEGQALCAADRAAVASEARCTVSGRLCRIDTHLPKLLIDLSG